MSIAFRSQVKDGLLVITASGRDDNLQQVLDYAQAVLRLVVESGVTKVLCDERELQYALNTFDTFEAAQAIAHAAPKIGRIAIVCHPKCLEDGKFWETVAVNRSLRVRVDTDIERVTAWLRGESAQPPPSSS